MEIILTAIIYLMHKSCVDIKMYSRMPSQLNIRLRYWYLMSDGVYLGGTLISYLMIAFTFLYVGYNQIQLEVVLPNMAVGLLLGSEIWDLMFGKVINDDPFYPFPDWYGGWGLKAINNTE